MQQELNLKEVEAKLKEWGLNNNIVGIGIDDWYDDYANLLQGEDVYIQSNQDVIDLLLDKNVSAVTVGRLLIIAWHRGLVDKDYHGVPDPKNAMAIGAGKMIGLIAQSHTAKVKTNGKEFEYKAIIGPPAFGKEDDHHINVTQEQYVTFYTSAISDKGVEYIKSYLQGKIVTEIKNRLTQLKAADVDYKQEAKLLKKAIDGIVKELS